LAPAGGHGEAEKPGTLTHASAAIKQNSAILLNAELLKKVSG
jgi:hypothetical protein